MVNNVTYLYHHKSGAAYRALMDNKVQRFYDERVKTFGGPHLSTGISGENPIVLISNDYLSLANHPTILSAISDTVHQYGTGLLMSAVFLDDDNLQTRFEHKMAEFMGGQHAMLCQSGWCANTGLLQAIADKETPIYLDMSAHMSLWEGAQSAGAKSIAFRHNNLEHLEVKIKKYGAGIIAIDSIYSCSGSIAPLLDILELAEKYGCIMVVDESHALGIKGNQGEGLVASLGVADRVHFRTASLSKAFCGRAGIIVCRDQLKDYLKYNSLPAIFSSAMLPYEIAGLDAALSVIQGASDLRLKLESNAYYLRSHLTQLGYNVSSSQTQIIPLEAGPEAATVRLRDALESRGVHGSVFCAPATPKMRSLVRFSVNASLAKEQMKKVIEVCADIRDEVDFENWPTNLKNCTLV